MEKVVLYSDKEKCCGCSACANICPKNAIQMKKDAYGFYYPEIQQALCIGCKACTKVCAFQKDISMNNPQIGFAAVNRDCSQLKNSASGGAFSAIAQTVLELGGRAYGAAYVYGEKLAVQMVGIDSIDELSKLQGSKYVQCDAGKVYKNVKQDLDEGKFVLFSGTPCMVGSLQGYLGKKYDNLLTIDIICHGTPNQDMLNDYLDTVKKPKDMITYLNFRDKRYGWSDFYLRYDINKKRKGRYIHCRVSSYYEHFLDGDIYRDSCYSCKYAGQKRCSDITIGDYWGIENQHRELFEHEPWFERKYKGISCVLINTKKGRDFLATVNNLEMIQSTFEKISAENGQLRHPTPVSDVRAELMELYANQGYSAIEKRFQKKLGINKYKDKIKSSIPVLLKRTIKKMCYRFRRWGK